jgi:hypothetical protein
MASLDFFEKIGHAETNTGIAKILFAAGAYNRRIPVPATTPACRATGAKIRDDFTTRAEFDDKG